MNWDAWRLDIFTWGWIVWMVFFVVWETFGIITGVNNTLTYHLRPLFRYASLLWFLGVGLWVWMGFHFFLEAGNPITGE